MTLLFFCFTATKILESVYRMKVRTMTFMPSHEDPDRDRQGFYTLRRTYSELYKKVNYTTPVQMVQNRIIEYDIKSANISMLRQAGVVKSSTLDELEQLPKKERQVIIGKMQKIDPKLKKVIARGIIQAKHDLFRANGIQDSEVLSIKNDALFIAGRKLKHTKFGEVEFRPKNTFAFYIKIEGIEFYYDSKNDSVAVKGINDAIVEHSDHQEGMIRFFAKVMRFMVYDHKDALRKYLIEFSDDYKNKRLPIQYYREFSSDNIYRTDMEISEYSFNLVSAGDADKEMINGVFNYMKFVLPLIQTFI